MSAAVQSFTVLFDPSCPLCRWLRDWLTTQRQLVPLKFVAAGSEEMRKLFPSLDPRYTVEEMHVIDDRGGLYVGEPAYIAVLWALEGYRGLAYKISSGPLRGVSKRMLAAISKYRPRHVQATDCTTRACGTARR